MARTAIAVQQLAGAYVTAAPLLVWTAADVANGNQFPMVRGDVLLVWNSDPTNPYTFTIASVPDFAGRSADITAQSLTAGQMAVYGPTDYPGWAQPGGQLEINGNNAAIKFAILRLSTI